MVLFVMCYFGMGFFFFFDIFKADLGTMVTCWKNYKFKQIVYFMLFDCKIRQED